MIKKIITWYACFVFFALFIIYHYFFFNGYMLSDEPLKNFFYAYNHRDHSIYYKYLESIEWNSLKFEDLLERGVNNFGIVYIYYLIVNSLSSLWGYVDIIRVSFYVNMCVFFLCFLSHRKIIASLGLTEKYNWLFFLNISFIYFAQLINKDSMTLLVFYKLIQYSLQKRSVAVVILFLFSILIRVQLPLIIFLYWLMLFLKPTWRNFIFVYVCFSLLNGVLSRIQYLFISEETISDGISGLVYSINVNYFVGSLLLNPIRLIQSFYSIYESFDFILEGSVDISKIKNITQLILLTYISPSLFRVYINYKFYMVSEARVLVAFVPSFFLVWFLNPTINSRYVMLLVPFLIILGFYEKVNRVNKPTENLE